jgi:hypothetical protein
VLQSGSAVAFPLDPLPNELLEFLTLCRCGLTLALAPLAADVPTFVAVDVAFFTGWLACFGSEASAPKSAGLPLGEALSPPALTLPEAPIGPAVAFGGGAWRGSSERMSFIANAWEEIARAVAQVSAATAGSSHFDVEPYPRCVATAPLVAGKRFASSIASRCFMVSPFKNRLVI